ncbi:SDR family oxidoreductase [Sphingomonas sp. OK281]|uniref:SDR family oxidoreductase n=1 Tax=Sphingomonas sp. OK281 TaxID=1881067 RepID=UPI0008DF6D44|nr:SDR family oxidoreductase [Sphingomonas sp. OK281]SFO19371.1 NADP-dependent 3-hydroxy acid dehydrogenase YdfG [Sphingomonas sp. OK281]
MGITGKVVAITGASNGIGRATAILLAEHGAFVVLGARNEEGLATVVKDIEASGGKAVFVATDVRRRDDLEALVALAVEQGGRLDVIINCAGIGPISRFDALDVDGWDAMIDVNLRGTLYGIAAALPVFARQASGHVINVVSTAGIKLVPTMGVYAATKNAVRTATEVLRQEAGPHLRVTEVSPGMIATSFGDSITDLSTKTAIAEQVDAIAIPPDAIARGILYAIDQPPHVEVGSIVIRPTAQG